MTLIARVARPTQLAVFRNRNFGLLWTSQLISTVGTALNVLAASILVYRLTGSALSVGLMMMATALPSLVVGLLAGVFVDRWDRRRIMIAADMMRGALVALIPFLLPYGVAWLYLIVLLSSTIGQFFEPAHASLLPEVATDDELAAANALMQISSFGATALGFAASGLIAARFPIEWAFYLDALSFVLSAILTARVRLAATVPDGRASAATVLGNLRAGLRCLVDTPILRSLFLVCIPAFVGIGLINAVLLPLALHSLHGSELDYGLLEGLASAGFIAGALLMARVADRLHAGQWFAMSFLGLGFLCASIALAPDVQVVFGLYAIGGLVNAPHYIGRHLVIQRNTPRDMRGRVNSAFLVSRNALLLVGMVSAGLADFCGPRTMYLVGALLVLAAGGLVLLLPGLGQPMAEWRQTVALLRTAQGAPGLGLGRAATPADLDLLAARLPAIAGIGVADRRTLTRAARVFEVPPGTALVRQGERGDAAYFILDGRAVAGRDDAGSYESLEVLQAGDLFGEIAALTGVARTAHVIADQPTRVLQVPAAALRHITGDAQLNRLVMSRMTERMVRMNLLDMPRLGVLDQQALRELRRPDPARMPVPETR